MWYPIVFSAQYYVWMSVFWRKHPQTCEGSVSSSSRVWAVVSPHIRAVCWPPQQRGETRCLGRPPSHLDCNLKSATTAREANVNSNIRFQSARTASEERRRVKNDAVWQNHQRTRPKPLRCPCRFLFGRLSCGLHAGIIRLICFSVWGCTGQEIVVGEVLSHCFWCALCWPAPSVPSGCREQSGFGISHSLSSQGLWPSADFTANCSLTPCTLLFGQLGIFSRHESNSDRHATVQPDNVSQRCRLLYLNRWSRPSLLSSS